MNSSNQDIEGKKKAIMQEINAAADSLKIAINKYFEIMDDPQADCCKKKLDFYIDHKQTNPGRRQTEEIEPDVASIRVVEL